ncbi:MAG: hypothetical protein JSV43_08575, partial [Methanobacteriota archaeon]
MRHKTSLLACWLCLALIFCGVIPNGNVEAQTSWTKFAGNPVLVNGGLFEWDMMILHPNVLEEPGGYKMWFTAETITPAFEVELTIGYATAPDQVTWTKHPSNPVMGTGAPGSWEELGVAAPWILPDLSGYRMWFTGMDANMLPQIGYAYSSDGLSWERYTGNPVITPGSPGDWDSGGVLAASVLDVGGVYHAWFTGANESGASRIGYATSQDGIDWTKYPGNPVIDIGAPGEWDAGSVMMPSVLFDGTKYRMWYTAAGEAELPDIGYAVSHDGINWTKHFDSPVLTKGSPGDWDEMYLMGSSVLPNPGGYDMWFGGLGTAGNSGIGYANCVAVPNRAPILTGGAVTPSVGLVGSTFTYNVTYRDEDNDPPLHVNVQINKSDVPVGGSPFAMAFDGWVAEIDNWSAGANFVFSTNFSVEGNDYTYAFEASDGEDTIFLEQTGPAVSSYFDPPAYVDARLTGTGFVNVLIEWWASNDDTGPGGTVERYDIFYGSTYYSGGSGYTILASVPAVGLESYFYEHLGGGDGNPDDYFYLICAVNTVNVTSCGANQAGKFIRSLEPGPNLISIPLIQAEEGIMTVLQTVKFDNAWNYDTLTGEWKWFMTSKPYQKGLEIINRTIGVWVNVTESSNLTVAGIVPNATTMSLHTGWNLVGFPSFAWDYAVSDLMIEVTAERVEGFDASAPPYLLKKLTDGDLLQTGY